MTISSSLFRKPSMHARKPSFTAALLVWFALAFAPKAHAGGVVSVCDEAHFLAAVSGGGNVTFSCSGTISLTHTVQQNTTSITIDGTGQSVTFTDGGASNLFFARSSCADTNSSICSSLEISNVTLTNAKDSAIVSDAGSVLVTGTTFTNNSTSHSGGAIRNQSRGSLTVRECTFSHNYAATGGAISNVNVSTFEVVRSTFVANGAADSGGAIFNAGTLMQINSSTLTSNFAKNDGGNIFDAGLTLFADVSNSTISQGFVLSGHGGNIASGSAGTSVLGLSNTIVANPVASENCDSPPRDFGGNLQWPPPGPYDSCGGVVANPKLGALQSNYGPTQTMELLPGSAAIDKGLDSLCDATDQRGILRPQGSHCDIGAYEFLPDIYGVVRLLESSFMNFTPRLPKTGAVKLAQQVIDPLSRSLDAAFWPGEDGNHLSPQRGSEVFELHQAVAINLSELIVNQAQLDYLKNLLFADRALAVGAMKDAICPVPSPAAAPGSGKCTQAQAELAWGDGSATAGNYGDAIAHYESTWKDVILR